MGGSETDCAIGYCISGTQDIREYARAAVLQAGQMAARPFLLVDVEEHLGEATVEFTFPGYVCAHPTSRLPQEESVVLPYVFELVVTANYYDFGDNPVYLQAQCVEMDRFVVDVLEQALGRRVAPFGLEVTEEQIAVTGYLSCKLRASYWAEFPLHYPLGATRLPTPSELLGSFSPSRDTQFAQVCP